MNKPALSAVTPSTRALLGFALQYGKTIALENPYANEEPKEFWFDGLVSVLLWQQDGFDVWVQADSQDENFRVGVVLDSGSVATAMHASETFRVGKINTDVQLHLELMEALNKVGNVSLRNTQEASLLCGAVGRVFWDDATRL